MVRRIFGFVVVAAAVAAPASAQLDPLLFIKDTAPYVLVAVDTSSRMQRDAPTTATDLTTSNQTSAYYDPWEYRSTGAAWEATLGIPAGTATYRRKYFALSYTGSNATVSSIGIVTNNNVFVNTAPPGTNGVSTYSLFEAPTRLSIARAAIYQAIVQNLRDVQFGLLKMRQSSPAAATQGSTTGITGAANTGGTNDTEGGGGTWNVSCPLIGPLSNFNTAPPSDVPPFGAGNAAYLYDATSETSNEDIQAFLAKGVQSGGLIPAGVESPVNVLDAPINNLLVDARLEATRLITGDTNCTNTIVVLITGGGEAGEGLGLGADPTSTAATFMNVGGRRVPIYVVAIAPPATDVAQLKAIAANSGGQYFEITKSMIDAALASPLLYGARKDATGAVVWLDNTPGAVQTASPIAGTVIVPEAVAAINVAIQHGFARPADVNTAPTAAAGATPALPFGPFSEFQTASPVVGTVNLENAKDITGAILPNTKILDSTPAKALIPQRSNVMLTTAFLAPGAATTLPDGTIMATSLNGSLRAFRVYKPVVDATKSIGYSFKPDGTRLWVACAPGPTPDGMSPCGGGSFIDSSKRNLYTATTNGTIVPFTTANVAVLAGLMNLSVADATNVITWVRNAPLGTMVDSTPAVMDPPSLDPPPDNDSYPRFIVANKDRRSIVWVGTNAGILEGIDARLGVEVWGFIPMNLLPKLKMLRLGQGLSTFEYSVDGSPKVADVKVVSGVCTAAIPSDCWRTHLVVGEGAGGMFYQSFDVTLKGMSDVVKPDSDNIDALLTYFSDPSRITLNWEFPKYSDFDATATVFDANSDSFQQFGDLKAAAPAVEKSVGQTWSTPAIGQVTSTKSPYAVLFGSGFLPSTTQQQANRGGAIAGTTFYILNAKDGTVYTASDVGSDGINEGPGAIGGVYDDCALTLTSAIKHTGKKKKVFACNQLKNALQSDVATTATGPVDSRFIAKAYAGDLDGNLWRWDVTLDGSLLPSISAKTKLYSAGSDQPIFASIATVYSLASTPAPPALPNPAGQYLFFGTGSDLLPSTDAGDVYKLVSVIDTGAANAVANFSRNLGKGGGDDEKLSGAPAIAKGIVFFATTTFKPLNSCVNLQDANLYGALITGPGGGGAPLGYYKDVNGNLNLQVATVAGQRATAPTVVNGLLLVGAGGSVAVFGDANSYSNGVSQSGIRILSWREVR